MSLIHTNSSSHNFHITTPPLNHIIIFQVFTVQTVVFHTLTPYKLQGLTNLMRLLFHVNRLTSEEFPLQHGVQQGDAIPTILFNLVLESTMRKTAMNLCDTIFMVHADDALIIGRMQDAIKQARGELTKTTHRLGLADNQQTCRRNISDKMIIYS